MFLKATARLETQYRWAQKCIVLNTDTVPTVLQDNEFTAMVGMAYSMRIVLRKLAIRVRGNTLLAHALNLTSCSGVFGGWNTVCGRPFGPWGMVQSHGTHRPWTSRFRKHINQQANASSTRRLTDSEMGSATWEPTL